MRAAPVVLARPPLAKLAPLAAAWRGAALEPGHCGRVQGGVTSGAFKVACAGSFLPSVALAVLWARSPSHLDGVMYADPSGRGNWSHCLHTRHGAVHYLYTGPPQLADPGLRVLAGPQSPPLAAMVDRPHWRVLGFAGGGVNTFWFLSVPFWFLILSTAALPGAWLWCRARRRSLATSPVCPKCGYDLTGNISGVCPECGARATPRESGARDERSAAAKSSGA